MTDSKLPMEQKKNHPLPSQSSSAVQIGKSRTHQVLMIAGLGAIVGALGVFFLTQYIFFSALLGLLALAFFGSRQLVKKSLALTSDNQQLMISSAQHDLEQINKAVSKCKYLENVETEGEMVAFQGRRLLDQYKNLKTLLSQKFDPAELTFSRYLGGIEASCLSIGENLLLVKTSLENLNLIPKSSAQRESQLSEVKSILTSTDDALQELGKLFNSLNEITTKEKHRDQLDQSMQQIKVLAERAKAYSKH